MGLGYVYILIKKQKENNQDFDYLIRYIINGNIMAIPIIIKYNLYKY